MPQTKEETVLHIPETNETLKGDGDPLDAVEISGHAYEIGEVVPSVVLGVIGLIDQGELDWKVICMNKKVFDSLNQTEEEVMKHNKGLIDYVMNFFKYAKTFEFKKINSFLKGRELEDKHYAFEVIENAMNSYNKLQKEKAQ